MRKILGVKTTFIDRSKDNKTVMDMAQKKVNDETKKHKTPKQLKPFLQVYEERKLNLFKQIIRSEERNPLKVLTFQKETLKPTFVTARPGTKRRVGKPRTKWVETALEAIWQQIRETMPELRGAIMNLENPEHVKAIQQTANSADKNNHATQSKE